MEVKAPCGCGGRLGGWVVTVFFFLSFFPSENSLSLGGVCGYFSACQIVCDKAFG